MATNHAPRNAANPFTIVSSGILRNPDLSSVECRVISILLSLPQGWQPNVKHLSTQMREGTSAIQGAITRLKQLGYLVCRSIRDVAGRFLRSDWDINEIPTPPSGQNMDVRGNVIAVDRGKKAPKNLRREANYRVKNGQKLASKPQAETLTAATFDPYTENPYTDSPNTDFREGSNIHIPNIQISIEREARANVFENLKDEDEGQEVSQNTVNFQSVKESDSTTEPTIFEVAKCSVPSSPVKRQEFYEALLTYCYQRVDINSPEGYATSVIRECRSRVPEASAAMLWAEFNAGEELGSRMVPPGFRLRGVPEQVVIEAISQDYMGKVGTTQTEAARSAASQLRRLPVVAAVATAVKLQLERCIENANRQVELGVPKERAILNNLPTYAVACNEDLMPQIAAAEVTEALEAVDPVDSVDPYALTEENRIARDKAFEVIRGKFPRRFTKREQILAANSSVDVVSVTEEKPATNVKIDEDEPILW